MKKTFYPSNEYDSSNGCAPYVCSPDAVVLDQRMTKGEKRALLASWASDSRAVENLPALRRLDNGSLVEIDAILEALKRLDGVEDELPPRPVVVRRRPRHWHLRSWIIRGRHDDDDDDPPTAPAAQPWPRPVPLVDAAVLAPAA